MSLPFLHPPHVKKQKGHLKCWLLWLLSLRTIALRILFFLCFTYPIPSITNDFPIPKPKVEGPLYLSDAEVASLWI